MVLHLESFEAVADWTVFGNDTDNLAVSTTRIEGTNSIEFDKVDGLANTTIAGCYRTVSGITLKEWHAHDKIVWHVYVSATTNVASAFIRLGTSATNYAEWRFADSSLTAGAFTQCAVEPRATPWPTSAWTTRTS
jgi:hypothetical protein